jgi:MFS transporter, DHA2 family, methylenomycin A resistance protein
LPLGLFAIGVLAAVAFVAVEWRTTEPMLPLWIFRRGELSAATTIGLLMNFSFYGLLFVETLLLERIYGFSPLITGVALLPQTGVIAFGSWPGGVVTGRSGPKIPMAVGMATGAAGFLGLTVAGPHTPYPMLIVPDDGGRLRHLVLHARGHVRGGRAAGGAAAAAAGMLSGARVAMVIAGAAYLFGFLVALTVRRSRAAPDAQAQDAQAKTVARHPRGGSSPTRPSTASRSRSA